MITLRREDFDSVVDAAAERGAAKALAAVGLDWEGAAQDVRELRGLLSALGAAKKTALATFVKLMTTAVIVALLAGAAVKLRVYGNGQ